MCVRACACVTVRFGHTWAVTARGFATIDTVTMCHTYAQDTSVQPSTTPLDPTDRSEPSASASGPGGRDHELCTFRHPPLVAVQRGVICRQWLKTGVCGGSCRQLHPSPGLIERTDCLSSSHPRLFCNGRRFGQPCPFRHDDPLGRYKPQAAVCTRWADYACNDPLCPFAHPYERPEPTGAASKTKLKVGSPAGHGHGRDMFSASTISPHVHWRFVVTNISVTSLS